MSLCFHDVRTSGWVHSRRTFCWWSNRRNDGDDQQQMLSGFGAVRDVQDCLFRASHSIVIGQHLLPEVCAVSTEYPKLLMDPCVRLSHVLRWSSRSTKHVWLLCQTSQSQSHTYCCLSQDTQIRSLVQQRNEDMLLPTVLQQS